MSRDNFNDLVDAGTRLGFIRGLGAAVDIAMKHGAGAVVHEITGLMVADDRDDIALLEPEARRRHLTPDDDDYEDSTQAYGD